MGQRIFETEAAGRAAKAQLLRETHGNKTIPEMLKGYAMDDYTGKANTNAYAQSVYEAGDKAGVDLRGKKIKDLSPKEFEALLDGMKKVEGFKEGTVTRSQSRADASDLPALTPEQQKVYQMASGSLGTQLGATHSPAEIDTLARSAAVLATEHGGRGEVQGVYLSKDQQTIALRQEFGISEIGVKDALNRSPTDAGPRVAAPNEGLLHAPHQPEAPQIAALSR